MASRFYLPATGTAPVSPTPSTDWEVTTGYGTLPAELVKSNTALTNGTARAKTATATVQDRLDRIYVSDALAAQTISNTGTISAVIRAIGSASTNNSWLNIIVQVVSGDGTTVRGVLYSGSSDTSSGSSGTNGLENQEIGTTLTTRIKNALALTNSISVQAGDRLVIEIGFRQTTSNTNTITFNYGDPSATADLALTAGSATAGVPWVEFSQDIALLPISAFTDDFSALSSSWTSYGTTGNISSTAGQMRIVGSTTFTGRSLNTPYALVGSSAVIELVQTLNQGAGGTYTYFNLNRDSSNKVTFDVRGAGLLTARRTIAGTETQITSTTYNPTTHRWLRMREDTGTLYWDYSSDGVSWTNFTSVTVASTFPVVSVYPELGAGWTGTETGTAIFDNLNLAPSATTHQGAVALSASATLTANASPPIKVGAVALSTTSSLAVAATVSRTGAATLASTATLSTGALLPGGATTLVATSVLTANGVRTTSGAATLSVASALTSNAILNLLAAVTLSSTVELSLSGLTLTVVGGFGSTTFGSVPFGAGNQALLVATTLSVGAGSSNFAGSATLSVASSLTANAVRTTNAVAALNAVGALSVSAALVAVAEVNLTAPVTLSASALVPSGGTVLAAGSSLSVLGIRTTIGVATLSIVVVLSSAANLGAFSVVNLVSNVALSSAGVRITSGVVFLSSTTSLVAGAFLTTTGVTTLVATPVLTAFLGPPGLGIILTVGKTLTVGGLRATSGSVSLSAVPVLMTAVTVGITQGVVTLSTLSTLSVSGTRITSGALSLSATAVLIANALSGNTGSANLASAHSLLVNGILTKLGAAQLNSTSSLSILSTMQGFGLVDLTTTAQLLAGASAVIKVGAITLLASTGLSAGIVRQSAGALSLLANALLQFIEVFPTVVFSVKKFAWVSGGIHVDPPRLPVRTGVSGWTTDGIRTESTWS